MRKRRWRGWVGSEREKERKGEWREGDWEKTINVMG
jgi:hypothetical protein